MTHNLIRTEKTLAEDHFSLILILITALIKANVVPWHVADATNR